MKLFFNTTNAALLCAPIAVALLAGCQPKLVSTTRTVTVVAVPAVIANTGTSTITASVVDVETYDNGQKINQPIEGDLVKFASSTDCGKLSADTASTKSNGNCSVTFTPAVTLKDPCTTTITATDSQKKSGTCTLKIK